MTPTVSSRRDVFRCAGCLTLLPVCVRACVLPWPISQMDKELTMKIYETMVKLNIMDNIFYEAQRQVPTLCRAVQHSLPGQHSLRSCDAPVLTFTPAF